MDNPEEARMNTRNLWALALAGLMFTSMPALTGDHPKQKDHKAAVHKDGRHDRGLHRGWHKQQWKRGERIPIAYVERVYYVPDYTVYHLRRPPVGYVWVRPMDDRYLLVQLTTGLIVDALGY